MTPNEHIDTDAGSAEKGNEKIGSKKDPIISVHLEDTQAGVEGILDPVIARREKKLKDLATKREAQELSPHDFDLNFIHQLNQAGLPLTRKDLTHETGNQALILTYEEFQRLGCLDFVHVSEGRISIDPDDLDPNDVFILYPEEIGDEE